jgi:hypothetical protein
MRGCAKIIAWISLIGLMIPAFLFLADKMTQETAKSVMLWATVVWFIAAPIGMWKEDDSQNPG